MDIEASEKIKKVRNTLLMIFILIQPILDTYYLYTDKVIELFGFSPSTIIRFLIVSVLLILTVSIIKDRKTWILMGISCILIITYTIMHTLNALNFKSLVPGNFNYSLKSELFYILRMSVPIAVIFITYKSHLKKEYFEKIVMWTLGIVSGSIVITNLLKISLGSYNNIIIKDNIIGWFLGAYDKYNYSSLASKGFFNFANQISALLVFLLPIAMVVYMNKKTLYNLITIILTIISMVMVGTKVALFGTIIDIFVFTVVVIFISLIKKKNMLNIPIIIMIGLSILTVGVLITKAPAINREKTSYNIRINNQKVEQPIPFSEDIMKSKESMIEYIEANYKPLMVGEQFITKSYPYKYDPEFWVEIINLPVFERLNWRNIEQKMLQRVMDINNNPMDKLLGLTFSRTQNIYNLESDFVSQYYSLGLIGVGLFLGPYILIILASILFIIKRFKKRVSVENTIICFATIFALGVSYYSGNVLDSLTMTIILGFVLGNLINIVFNKEEQ